MYTFALIRYVYKLDATKQFTCQDGDAVQYAGQLLSRRLVALQVQLGQLWGEKKRSSSSSMTMRHTVCIKKN